MVRHHRTEGRQGGEDFFTSQNCADNPDHQEMILRTPSPLSQEGSSDILKPLEGNGTRQCHLKASVWARQQAELEG